MNRPMFRGVFALVFSALASLGAQQAQPSFDVLIHNGRVMDGSGNPWLSADIGIRGGLIAAVGELKGAQAPTLIDAADRLVTPGFIDVHSHAAEGLIRPTLRQGQPLLALRAAERARKAAQPYPRRAGGRQVAGRPIDSRRPASYRGERPPARRAHIARIRRERP